MTNRKAKSNDTSKNVEEEIKVSPEDQAIEIKDLVEEPQLFEVCENFSKIIIKRSILTRSLQLKAAANISDPKHNEVEELLIEI